MNGEQLRVLGEFYQHVENRVTLGLLVETFTTDKIGIDSILSVRPSLTELKDA